MRRAAKRAAKPRRTTPTAGRFEPWQEDAARKFGVSVSVVAEHFRPEDVTRLEQVFNGRTLETFPLAEIVGERNCFLRAFSLSGFAVPFLIEHLDHAIRQAEHDASSGVRRRAVGDRDFRAVAGQAKRLAASLRAVGLDLLDSMLWQDGDHEYGARTAPFLEALDDVADVAAGNRWCLAQYTRRDLKGGLEGAVCEEMALHGLLSAFRDGLTADVLRVAYEAAGIAGGADPSRVLRAMAKRWPKPVVRAKRAMRRAELERILRSGTAGDQLTNYWTHVWLRLPPPDESGDVPI